MQIQITRHTGKAHSIVFRRADGSETWQPSDDFFIRHDLSHYAIEKTLGYKTAFLGMIEKGMGVRDFEDRAKRKSMLITTEAWYAENMANLFLMERTQGKMEDFNSVSRETFAQLQLSVPPPNLTNTEVAAIRKLLEELLQQWNSLANNESILLTIDI
ncbi:MAG: hypothetical protein ACKVOW_16585 [Chitinophagaceae bacterium]